MIDTRYIMYAYYSSSIKTCIHSLEFISSTTICYTFKGWRWWSIGLRARRIVVLSWNRQLGRGMRSTWRPRCLCKGVPLPGLDQTNHQQILEWKTNPSGLLLLFFKLFILNVLVYLLYFMELSCWTKKFDFFFTPC